MSIAQSDVMKAYNKLSYQDRVTIDRLADDLEYSMKHRREKPAGLGRLGALELLAALGVFMVEHDKNKYSKPA